MRWGSLEKWFPHITQVTSPQGDLYPTAGCRIVEIKSSGSTIYEVRLIAVNGEEWTIDSIELDSTSIPQRVIELRDRVVDAIMNYEPRLDLREQELKILFPSFPREHILSDTGALKQRAWYVSQGLPTKTAVILVSNQVTPEELLTMPKAVFVSFRNAGPKVFEDIEAWQKRKAHLLK